MSLGRYTIGLVEQERLPGADIPAQGPDRIYKRREVFVVGGQPTVTYNPRPAQPYGAEKRLRDAVRLVGDVLCASRPDLAWHVVDPLERAGDDAPPATVAGKVIGLETARKHLDPLRADAPAVADGDRAEGAA